jgi:membrane fusion protein, macrolide-specific efflux system
MKKKGILVAALIVTLCGGLAEYRRMTTERREKTVYEAVAFGRERLETRISATGVVEPRNRIEIKPPIGGRMEEVLVAEGQKVAKGELIARMSSTERATLLDAARAKGADMLNKWEDAFKSTSLIAPLEGTIIARNTEPGQTVTASDAVLVLSDRLVVSARVDETDIGMIKAGQSVNITLDAYRDVKVKGVVKRIAYDATTVNNVTIYKVEVEPESIPTCMKSGMTATVGFLLAEVDNALTLPADSIAVEQGKSYVLVASEMQGDPVQRWRILPGLSSAGRVEILAGLEGDEAVVRKPFAISRAAESGNSPFVPGPPSKKR